MSNVHHIHEDNIGLAQLVVELRKDKAAVDVKNAVYREMLLGSFENISDLLDLIDYLIDPFRQAEVEKKTDKVRAILEVQRLAVEA